MHRHLAPEDFPRTSVAIQSRLKNALTDAFSRGRSYPAHMLALQQTLEYVQKRIKHEADMVEYDNQVKASKAVKVEAEAVQVAINLGQAGPVLPAGLT